MTTAFLSSRLMLCRVKTDSDWYEGFQEGANILGGSPIGILDLRFNCGGQGAVVVEWLKNYAKTLVPSNSLFINAYSGKQMNSARDLWLSNDNILIILTSKWTASAAEWMIDTAYNLENVLIIGDNTSGEMVGSIAYVQLGNSKMIIGIGSRENIVPDTNDYFEEFRRLLPRPLGPGGRGGGAGRQADGKPGRGAGRRRSGQPGRIKRRRLP